MHISKALFPLRPWSMYRNRSNRSMNTFPRVLYCSCFMFYVLSIYFEDFFFSFWFGFFRSNLENILFLWLFISFYMMSTLINKTVLSYTLHWTIFLKILLRPHRSRQPAECVVLRPKNQKSLDLFLATLVNTPVDSVFLDISFGFSRFPGTYEIIKIML